MGSKYLEDADGVVFEVDLSKLLASKDFEPILELLDVQGNLKRQLGMSVREIELFGTAFDGPQEEPFQRFVLKTKKELEPLQIMRLNRWISSKEVPDTHELQGKTYYSVKTRRSEIGIYQPDYNSMVVGPLEAIEDRVKGRKPKQTILRSKEWKALSDFQLKFAFGETLFKTVREEYKRFNEAGGAKDPLSQLLMPINEKVEKIYGGMRMGQKLDLRVTLFANNSDDAKDVISSLEAALQIGKTMLASTKPMLIESAGEPAMQKVAGEAFAVLDQFIKSLKMERKGRQVVITAGADVKSFVKNVLPETLMAARTAARRTQSMNNLKQLALSMHNYHDTHKGMPPAVIIGPKGHKHSWRIAMLPYLEQQALYEQYRMDEPWDSPNNTKVMNMMPEVFRHPNDPPGSTSTRYLAFVGPGTAFENPEGVQFRDIVDGTSNTIMFFSGATNVPWTKPEDIEYDPEKEINLKDGPFEKGFNAVMFDGSVQFFSSDLGQDVFHKLIQMSDGGIIDRR